MASTRCCRARSCVHCWSSQAVSAPLERASLRVTASSMGAGGRRARDLRWPIAQRRRRRHESHVRHHGRVWPAHQRRGRPGHGASVGQVPRPGAAESRPRGRRQGPGLLQGRRPTRLSPSSRSGEPLSSLKPGGANPTGSTRGDHLDGLQRACDDGGGHRRRGTSRRIHGQVSRATGQRLTVAGAPSWWT
jgi:hypothetical protein